ncbi:Biotin/lipoate A/B protein ligase [Steccherinum ochraceum]|uniref:Putative lipoate-protein ligase A n=1 Tax=Steccherinum ochraceum TaxID=92696 RepID=A0A4R0R8A4_9APHY|nr:Biotin/lipoate A/B protein ligase [Steccherinum ochraceum]
MADTQMADASQKISSAMTPQQEDSIIHTRITNDEKALRRVTKRFHAYTAVAYNSGAQSPPIASSSAGDARDAFLVELASFHLSLKKSLMVCEAEARQVEEYQRERERLETEQGNLKDEIEELKISLEQAQLERKRKMEYDVIAEKVNALPTRDELEQSIRSLENDMTAIRAEQDTQSRTIQAQKTRLDMISTSRPSTPHLPPGTPIPGPLERKEEGEEEDIEMGELAEEPKSNGNGKKKAKPEPEELEEGEASDLSSELSDPPDDYTRPALSPNHAIYVSNSTNPYFNLTLEDWLFRHADPKRPLLLLYRDSPCVVIGRNQNPWKEVNLDESRTQHIPWIRRRSGGGTVYHDLGNTNYSIHLPRAAFDRRVTAKTVTAALTRLAIPDAHVNARNDICVREYKVSGSAYKIVNSRAYHHGTMLIGSDLGALGSLLRVQGKEKMQTKGVESVRSPVVTLNKWYPHVTHEKFVDSVIREFRLDYDIDVDEEVHYIEENESATSIEYIRHGMEELKSWDWAYGQTPEFTYEIEHQFKWGKIEGKVHSKHGIILDCTFQCSEGAEGWQGQANKLGEWLKGRRYDLKFQWVQCSMDEHNALQAALPFEQQLPFHPVDDISIGIGMSGEEAPTVLLRRTGPCSPIEVCERVMDFVTITTPATITSPFFWTLAIAISTLSACISPYEPEEFYSYSSTLKQLLNAATALLEVRLSVNCTEETVNGLSFRHQPRLRVLALYLTTAEHSPGDVDEEGGCALDLLSTSSSLGLAVTCIVWDTPYRGTTSSPVSLNLRLDQLSTLTTTSRINPPPHEFILPLESHVRLATGIKALSDEDTRNALSLNQAMSPHPT